MLVDAKRKTKRKLKIFTESNKRLNLAHLFPGNGTTKSCLLMVYMRINFVLTCKRTSPLS
jgi:hypothetical protein